MLLLVCCSCGTDKLEPAKQGSPAIESEPIVGAELLDKQEQTVDQGTAIANLIAAYEKAYDECRALRATVKSREEKRKFVSPSINDYSADMMTVIERDVQSQAAFDGLLWLYESTNSRDEASYKKVSDICRTLLIEHHSAKQKIGMVAEWIAYADKSQRTERNLQRILENNKHEIDLAKAVLGMIRHYQALKEIQTDSKTRGFAEEQLDEEGMAYVDSRSREELNLLIDKYFAIGLEEYGKVQFRRSTFAETLAPFHFEHTRLQIGMQAPDIIGEDIAGVKFKLSDYKGKVVMLDFWGDW